jgi:hypothetical protein
MIMHDRLNPTPNNVAYVDPFMDSHMDTNFWENVVTGDVTILESLGKVIFSHEIAGVIGLGELKTKKKFGWQQTISVGMTVVTGSNPADGNHLEAWLTLYKDATHFIKFGPYRDTAEGKNTISRLYYQNGGALTIIDFSVTPTDALLHQYTLAVLENRVVMLLDGTIVYDLEMLNFLDYIVKLEMIATAVGDHLHVNFSNFICSKNTEFLTSLFASGSSAALLAQLLLTDAKVDNANAQLLTMDTKHTFSGNLTLNGVSAVELNFLTSSHGDQFELVLAAALGQGVMPKALQDDGGSLTDYTDECNSLITRDIMLFPAIPADGDSFIIMSATKFCYVDVYMAGGIANSDNVISLQYYRDDHSWVAIPGVVDGTFDTQSLGQSGRVSFSPPADWDTQTLDGFTGYAIRFVIATHGVDVPYATHIQISDDTSASFDQVAHEFDSLMVYIKRNFPTIGYQSMVGDRMEYVQCIGDRDVDINGIRCCSDTKVGFQLGAIPDKPITLPYFGYTRRI